MTVCLDPYYAKRPAPRDLRATGKVLLATLRRFVYFVCHTLRVYESGAGEPPGLSSRSPAGTLSVEQLKICERLASEADDRLAAVEQKATTLLTLVAVLAPLSASAAVFVVRTPLSPEVRLWVLSGQLGAFFFLLLASVATMRALAIREHKDVGVGGLVAKGTIRAYSVDFEGRGLLYTAAMRHAITDHVADFVRAAQVFLWIGIAAQVGAGTCILAVAQEKPSQLEATVNLTPSTLRALGDAHSDHDVVVRIDSLAQELSRTQRVLDHMKMRIVDSSPRADSATTTRHTQEGTAKRR
jgi:hypothetical protein